MTLLERILLKIKLLAKPEYVAERLVYMWSSGTRRKLRAALNWFKYRFFPQHRYHILNLCKSGNDYKHGWYDTDTRMLHACFLLLVEYVELEKPFDVIDWEHNEQSKYVASEIKYLYNWWKIERPAAKSKLAWEWSREPMGSDFEPLEDGGYKVVQSENTIKLLEKERQLDKLDQTNLERLIHIRSHLWT